MTRKDLKGMEERLLKLQEQIKLSAGQVLVNTESLRAEYRALHGKWSAGLRQTAMDV